VSDPNPHCRIGRVKPKLALYRNDPNVIEPDWNYEGEFVEDMIGVVRSAPAANGFTFLVTHEDGSVTAGSRSVKGNSDFQMLGALAFEMVNTAARMKAGG
jgi:hypothetical protein